MTPEKDRLCEFVDHVLSEETKEKIYERLEVDEENRNDGQSYGSFNAKGDAEYRHSLIITDKTKAIHSQENMLCADENTRMKI